MHIPPTSRLSAPWVAAKAEGFGGAVGRASVSVATPLSASPHTQPQQAIRRCSPISRLSRWRISHALADELDEPDAVLSRDYLGRLLADHDRGRIGVATDHGWHDARVRH